MEITKIRIGKNHYSITPTVAKKMKQSGVNSAVVRTRVKNGWIFSDAINAPVGMRLKEWNNLKPVNEAKNYRERMEKRRLERLRRKKPHLFTVPQKYSRSKWCKHLMENDIFPKKVVR